MPVFSLTALSLETNSMLNVLASTGQLNQRVRLEDCLNKGQLNG